MVLRHSWRRCPHGLTYLCKRRESNPHGLTRPLASGLSEPLPPDKKSGASANSATLAFCLFHCGIHKWTLRTIDVIPAFYPPARAACQRSRGFKNLFKYLGNHITTIIILGKIDELFYCEAVFLNVNAVLLGKIASTHFARACKSVMPLI